MHGATHDLHPGPIDWQMTVAKVQGDYPCASFYPETELGTSNCEPLC